MQVRAGGAACFTWRHRGSQPHFLNVSTYPRPPGTPPPGAVPPDQVYSPHRQVITLPAGNQAPSLRWTPIPRAVPRNSPPRPPSPHHQTTTRSPPRPNHHTKTINTNCKATPAVHMSVEKLWLLKKSLMLQIYPTEAAIVRNLLGNFPLHGPRFLQ
ncbi:hypothetical protein E2C01_052365 [Portunus trituberculatus]|uniref:Uncharacterized protein n=1 Tax=Portunus trituberculatus TaxID=210409 RepID=A0A5B7GP59_PORTR|nr:hypothetical protein [Portunus trituberculatus]